MCESISVPLITAMMATGRIRNYQIIVGGLQMLNFPLSYIALSLGYMPETTIVIMIVVSLMCLAARLYMLKNMIMLNILNYVRKVLLNALVVSCIALILPVILHNYMQEDFQSFIILSVVCIISSVFSVLLVGCSNQEREMVWNFIKKKINDKVR